MTMWNEINVIVVHIYIFIYICCSVCGVRQLKFWIHIDFIYVKWQSHKLNQDCASDELKCACTNSKTCWIYILSILFNCIEIVEKQGDRETWILKSQLECFVSNSNQQNGGNGKCEPIRPDVTHERNQKACSFLLKPASTTRSSGCRLWIQSTWIWKEKLRFGGKRWSQRHIIRIQFTLGHAHCACAIRDAKQNVWLVLFCFSFQNNLASNDSVNYWSEMLA